MQTHPLLRYTSIADAIVQLFNPSVEAIIHEISTDTVFYIANPISGRKIGDISLLGMDNNDFNDHKKIIGPYEKAGEKGQRVRSITSILPDDEGNAIGLLCINLDYSTYEPALDLLENLIRPVQTAKHPEFLFQNDWRDQIKIEVRAFATENNFCIGKLTPPERKYLISHLEKKGLFYAKKSIEQLATILGISRATAYKDLSSIRKTNPTTAMKSTL